MRAILVYNPCAGSGRSIEDIDTVVGMLHRRGWIVRVQEIRKAGDAAHFTREAAADGYEMALVAGGDGTVSSAVQGLVGSQTALGVLPAGTGNVLARQLGMPVPGPLHPTILRKAAELILGGEPHLVDLGLLINATTGERGRYFLCWAGIGIDAAITQEVELFPQLKRRLGLGAFVISALQVLRHYAGTRAELIVDGQRVRPRRMLLAVASNMELYGGFFHISPQARLDDGLLDFTCFRGDYWFDTLYHAFIILLRRHVRDPRVICYQAREIEISTARPLPVHVDAEPYGTTPVRIRVVPQALRLIIPSTAPPHILSRSDASRELRYVLLKPAA
ncbi:MAG: diacylglycerol kinase family lipid kinase [Anaerolineae bacterium]|nr:diacylglycerol kinase family lipid kinase [Anaerolineae bacterium]MDW8099322.1 diacylglycerol kinase family lipid kinase [Anaerolineae bacterium]